MNPFDGSAILFLGFVQQGLMGAWLSLVASMAATAFVALFGTQGTSIVAGHEPIGIAFGHASLVMALMVLALWFKNPLTRKIPILYPGKIEAARLEQLVADGTVYNPNEAKS